MFNLIEACGGRRFFLAFSGGIAATTLQWYGKLDPAGTSYVLLMGATVAAYITGDTIQRVKNASDPYSDRQASRVSPTAKLPRGLEDAQDSR